MNSYDNDFSEKYMRGTMPGTGTKIVSETRFINNSSGCKFCGNQIFIQEERLNSSLGQIEYMTVCSRCGKVYSSFFAPINVPLEERITKLEQELEEIKKKLNI